MKIAQLFEVAINARSSRKSQQNMPGVLIGWEFELSIPTDFHTVKKTPPAVFELADLSDEDELFDVFDCTNRNRQQISQHFSSWIEDQKEEYIDDNWEQYSEDEDEGKQRAEKYAINNLDLSFNAFCTDEYGSIRHAVEYYDLEPKFGWHLDYGYQSRHRDSSTVYTSEAGEDDTSEVHEVHEALAASLSEALTRKVVTFSNIKNIFITTDFSIKGGIRGGAEIVTPPEDVTTALNTLSKITEWAKNLELISNESTGVHLNISCPAIAEKIDPLKFVMFFDEHFVLKQFGRLSNTFAVEVLPSITSTYKVLGNLPETPKMTDDLWKALEHFTTWMPRAKYRSVNFAKLPYGYIEIRAAGGNWLNQYEQLTALTNRAIIALSAATNKKLYANQYIKKIVKMFNI